MVHRVAQLAEGDAKLLGFQSRCGGGAGGRRDAGGELGDVANKDVQRRPRVLSRLTLFGTSVAGTGRASRSRSRGRAGDSIVMDGYEPRGLDSVLQAAGLHLVLGRRGRCSEQPEPPK